MSCIYDIAMWDDDAIGDFSGIFVGDTPTAVSLLERERYNIVHNSLRTLEGLPITAPATRDILEGKTAPGVSTKDMLKVRALDHGLSAIVSIVSSSNFEFDKYNFCCLHSVVSEYEVENFERGKFRSRHVALHNVTYAPPEPHLLLDYWEKGHPQIMRIENPFVRACISFLWASRIQFFYDCNKRTASLVMNGILAANHIAPIFFPEEKANIFRAYLCDFYESGKANKILRFMRDCAIHAAPRLDNIH